jgi:hypothetical protein
MDFTYTLQKYLEHDLAMILIVIGYVSLVYLALTGKKVSVPGPYFLLVGLGSALATYSMIKRNKPTHIVVMEAFMALSSLYLYFK